jgi:hypothetical protein
VVRRIVAGAVLAWMLCAPAAFAQPGWSTGFVTASIGSSAGGDIADRGWGPGVAIAVVGENRVGAELDITRAHDFNRVEFSDSRITTVMINATRLWRGATAVVRPYAVGGIGLVHSRVCVGDCQAAMTQSAFGFDAGGGVYVVWNETVGARGDVRYFQSLQKPSDSPFNGYLNFWRTSIGITISWPIR